MKGHINPWELLKATSLLCQGDDSHPLLDGHREALFIAHIPRITPDEGIMANLGSKRTATMPTLEHMALAQYAQGEAVACDLIMRNEWNELLSMKPKWFGYSPRFDSTGYRCQYDDWRDSIAALRHASLGRELTNYHDGVAYLNQRFLIPELPAHYAMYIYGWVKRLPQIDSFFQMNTPGPSQFLDNVCVGYAEFGYSSAITLRDKYGYPSAFDGSALMCEAFRVWKHITGKEDLAKKRPRRQFQGD
jgi:hypothetical protein